MKKIIIEGMMCQHCANAVSKVISNLGGSDIEVNVQNGYAIADIESDDNQIKSAIDNLDYKVVDIVRV